MLQVPLDVDDDEACRTTFRVSEDDDDGDAAAPAAAGASPKAGDGQVLAAFGIEHYPRVGKVRQPAFRAGGGRARTAPRTSVFLDSPSRGAPGSSRRVR